MVRLNHTNASSASGYTLLDARVQWSDVLISTFDAAIFGKNLAIERHVIAGWAQTAAGYTCIFPSPPRMYGLALGYKC